MHLYHSWTFRLMLLHKASPCHRQKQCWLTRKNPLKYHTDCPLEHHTELKISLRKKCPYSELFSSVFFRIWTEYGERIQSEWGKKRTRITPNCRFSYTGTWELVDLFVGTKHFGYYICNEKIGRKNSKILTSQETDRPWTDRTEQYASNQGYIKWNK